MFVPATPVGRAADLGVRALPPGRQTGISKPVAIGWGLAISAYSKKQQAAWQFLQWATSKEIQGKLIQAGVAPPRTSVFRGPAFDAWANEVPIRRAWADTLLPAHGELVGHVEVDEAVVPEIVRADGAVALKLLVIWRADQPAGPRLALVDGFVARCKAAGLIGIVEPVCRKPLDGRSWRPGEGILEAARELGRRGQDIYKAEMPRLGQGTEAEVRRDCEALTAMVDGPWVVLSSGVAPDDFPRAVEWACKGGASGFLAGRGVWRTVIGTADVDHALQVDAVNRLRRLCDVVDRAVAG